MEIICKQCSYSISKIEVSLYLTAAIANFMVQILPYIQKKNMVDNFDVVKDQILLASANILKIKCPKCDDYKEWIFLKDNNF